MNNIIGGYIESNGKFLIVKRESNDQFNGMWQFPCTLYRNSGSDCDSISEYFSSVFNLKVRANTLMSYGTHKNDFKKLYKCDVLGYDRDFMPETLLQEQIASDSARYIDAFEVSDYEWYPADYNILSQLGLTGPKKVRKVEDTRKIG